MLYDVKNEYGISELKYWIAQSEEGPIYLIPKMGNRHGLIAGATGTGKTVTLQVLAETFSQAGVPCFMSDIGAMPDIIILSDIVINFKNFCIVQTV